MSDVLLATKIRVPALHRNIVNRPFLIKRLNDGLVNNSRLNLVSAPAGYGKSTLLSEWVSQTSIPVAWLSLEKAENTPAHFWSYFITALSTIPHFRQAGFGEAILQALQSLKPPPIDALLTNLVNELSKLQGEAVLVLDDLHTITEGKIHEDLVFLMDHLPLSANSLHLVVASRMDPPWPLARWRARGQLVEIRTADLRFKPTEAADFLNRVMKLDLSTEEVSALENRTEGWIAGLQMAAVSLQGREDVQEFILAFTGSSRYIFDYLVDEVLSRQEQGVQEFLLKTSILERLSASLCNTLLDHTGSQSILDQLEKTNLFLVSLDDERIWYRYHRLFADLLASSLRESHSEIIPELHRRACAWFEEHGFLAEALAHALTAGDLDRLAILVERYAFTIMEAFEASSLLNWLNSLPERVTNSYPWLNIARAWLLAYLGRNDQIEQAIDAAEKFADQEDRRICGYIAAMRTLAGELGASQMQDGIIQAGKALELLPQDEFRPRAFVCYHLANLLSWQGDDPAALKALEEASSLSLSAGDFELAMAAQFEIANILRYQGKLRQSMEVFETTLQKADMHTAGQKLKSFPVGYAYLQKAQIYLEWNNLERTLDLAREGIRLCKLWGYSDYLYNGWFIYAAILYEIGDLDEALVAIREAKHIFPKTTPGGREFALEAVINQARGDWNSTVAWLSACGMSPADTPDFAHRFEYYFFAVIFKEQGKLEEAFRLLDGLRVVAETAEVNNLLLKILPQEALIAYSLGEEEKALTLLQHALRLAEPEGYIHVFIKHGVKMEELLHKAVIAGISPDYSRLLLRQYPGSISNVPYEVIHPVSVGDEKRTSPLTDPLSKRELEVLHLLDTSLDSTEIAAELFISASTARTHIKNIYSKLNVNRRMQAVERAHDLKLL
jgi:LuxR family transcriptional regulator, maltose regulon positive regulatory protein